MYIGKYVYCFPPKAFLDKHTKINHRPLKVYDNDPHGDPYIRIKGKKEFLREQRYIFVRNSRKLDVYAW